MLLKLLFLASLSAIFAEKVRYDNFSLYRIFVENEENLQYLNGLQQTPDLHLWKIANRVGDYASFIASPKIKNDLEESFKKRNIKYDVMLTNVQEALENQLINRSKRDIRNELFWTNFQTMDDIYAWFHRLADTHKNIVSIIQAGTSYEGRNITGVKISRGSSRRAIFVEGGQIGADWLSPTVVTYIIDQLVKGDDPVMKKATEDYEWHIFPILNPDGHEFSQNVDRLWIKNRSPQANAVGVDLSKNWNSQWGVSSGSFIPSNSNYIGLGPFSEVETRSISRYIENMGASLSGHLSFRAFGQRLVIPFAHTASHMYNYNETILIGRRAMGSLAVRYNTQYLVGNSMEVFDGATGNMADWVKHRFNPPVAFTYYLRDNGQWGYILPVNQVLPTCLETYDSVVAIIREANSINVL